MVACPHCNRVAAIGTLNYFYRKLGPRPLHIHPILERFPLKRFAVNFLVMVVSLTVMLGGVEFTVRAFYPKRVRTYFEDQTETALGRPVPKKMPGEYRIFIFGGSSAYGFPLSDRFSITAWLRKDFSILLPGRKVRVTNTAWPGKGSHHVLEGALNVMQYKPDQFIIYDGHNEFYVANRLYLDNALYRLDLILKHRSAAYRLYSQRLKKLRKFITHGKSVNEGNDIPSKVYKQLEITDADYERILKRFEENTEEVLHYANKNGVEALLLTPPSNVREIPPGFSAHRPDLTAAELDLWRKYFNQGLALANQDKYSKAVQAFEKAVLIDSSYAELQYKLGLSYEKIKNFERTKKAFILARDLDGHATRARSSLEQLIREIAARHKTPLLDLVKIFEEISPHEIIGNDLIYDDVHPTGQAQLLIADLISKSLSEHGKIAPAEEWNWSALRASRLKQPES